MNVVTISTVELVELINTMRLAIENKTTMRHDALIAKVRHIHRDDAAKYDGNYVDSTGRSWRCYNLPESEAVALTTSYKAGISEAVRAKFADWTANGKTENILPAKIVVTEVPLEDDVTMTSLELVSYINNVRVQEGEFSVLTHDNFLKKVRQVLGDGAPKFNESYLNLQNKEQPMYRFPKREATLMAMSYSPTISAQIYDRMEALEKQVLASANVPLSFAEALMIAAKAAEAAEAAKQQEKINQMKLAE